MAGRGSLIANRYWLQGRREAGGTGEVWQARDLMLGRPVTLRLPRHAHAADAERFLAAARRAAQLRHPGIVRVCDYGLAGADGAAFLVTEVAGGCSLATVLRTVPLEPTWVLLVIRQVASALDAAHTLGLVHQAINPRNLLLAAGGTVKLTEFVSSQPAEPGTGCSRYTAPERTSATPAGDLYSLGVVAWECLTGRLAPAALADRGLSMPRLPALVGPGVAALVADLTAADCAVRLASAARAAERASELLATPMRVNEPLSPAVFGSGSVPVRPGTEPVLSFLAGEPRPGRLAGHAERLADARPGSPEFATAADPSGEALFDQIGRLGDAWKVR